METNTAEQDGARDLVDWTAYRKGDTAALERLTGLLGSGNVTEPEHKLVFPLRRSGDT